MKTPLLSPMPQEEEIKAIEVIEAIEVRLPINSPSILSTLGEENTFYQATKRLLEIPLFAIDELQSRESELIAANMLVALQIHTMEEDGKLVSLYFINIIRQYLSKYGIAEDQEDQVRIRYNALGEEFGNTWKETRKITKENNNVLREAQKIYLQHQLEEWKDRNRYTLLEEELNIKLSTLLQH